MESGILVTNIKPVIDEKAIRNYFEKFGKIVYLNFVSDKFNEGSKVCYIDYNSMDSAKKAVQDTDRSTFFGDHLRVSFKKIASNKSQINGNGPSPIARVQSFGRGRGIANDNTAKLQPKQIRPVMLHTIDLPLNTKVPVEIIELESLNNILARPLKPTEDSKHDLANILAALNEQTNTLIDVRVPEINGYYLARWEEDKNFYRAKLLEKLANARYKVCFVDEGTSGDIVTELKEIPKEITEFPCQFVPCDMECEESAELTKLIVSSGVTFEVSIFIHSPELNDGRYRISLFLGDNDVIDLFKKQYHKEPRKKALPDVSTLRKHQLRSEFKNYRVINFPKQQRDVFRVVLTDNFESSPKTEPLDCSPIPGDIVIYRQSNTDTCHRCVVEAVEFTQQKIGYKVRMVDDDRCVTATRDRLSRTNDKCLFACARLLNCVMDLEHELLTPDDASRVITIEDYDAQKDLYVIGVVRPRPTQNSSADEIIATRTVFVSHVESCAEFYVQNATDPAAMRAIESIQDCINANYRASRFASMRDLNVNQIVVAPFLGVNYRALVKEIELAKATVRVLFIDYGNSEWVNLADILHATEEVMRAAPLANRCRLSVVPGPSNAAAAAELLREYSGNGEVEVTIKVLADDSDVLTVDLCCDKKSGFVDILKFKKYVSESAVPIATVAGGDAAGKLASRVRDLETRIALLEKLAGRQY